VRCRRSRARRRWRCGCAITRRMMTNFLKQAATSAWDAFSLTQAVWRFRLSHYWTVTMLVLTSSPTQKPCGTVTSTYDPSPISVGWYLPQGFALTYLEVYVALKEPFQLHHQHWDIRKNLRPRTAKRHGHVFREFLLFLGSLDSGWHLCYLQTRALWLPREASSSWSANLSHCRQRSSCCRQRSLQKASTLCLVLRHMANQFQIQRLE